MHDIIRALRLAALIAIPAAGSAAAADFKADFTFNWRAVGAVHNLEDSHIAWQGNLGGLARPGAAADGPLARPILWMCPLLSDVGAGTSGFCIGTDPEGDKVFMRSAGNSLPSDQGEPGAIAVDAGTFTLYAGTGKFSGIEGALEFKANSYGFLPDGGFVGYTAVTGTYSVGN